MLLLGAGGLGRAIAFALANAAMADLVIANRDAAKASALAAEVSRATGIPALALPSGPVVDLAGFGLIANATSVGMGGSGGMPMATDGVPQGATVADVVISPQDTPFITAARAAGCQVMAGASMLRPQIELSELFLYHGAEG